MATFVLIPGAGGSAWYFHRLVPVLTERGHQAIAVDLPVEDREAGLPEYTDAALTAVDSHREDENLVVLGHSLGGFTAPQVAAEVGATLLVLTNPMVPEPGETPGDWWADTGQEQARVDKASQDGRDPEFDLADYFFHDVPADLARQALATPVPQSDAVFTTPWPLSAWPDVPTRVIQGRDDRFFPLEFQRRVVTERLGRTVDELPGGHLFALSRPVEIADQLDAYLREN